jgi:OmpA-OmpF porin, OOP family
VRLSPYIKAIYFVLAVVPWRTVIAQNFIANASFEKYKMCPGSFTRSPEEFTVPGWRGADINTPDHFHYCSRGDAGVPYNWAGVSEAYEGDGYSGIFLWMNDQDYREFLQCDLLQPLITDSSYYIEFHYKLSSYSNYAIDRIGLQLSSPSAPGELLNVIHDSALTRTTGLWEAARFEYKAKGNESVLTIGNFFLNAETKYYRIQSRPVSEPMLASASYYYIDGVIVVPKFRIQEQLAAKVGDAFTPEKASYNTPYVLKNIHFEFNSARLEPSSFNELDRLVNFLSSNMELKVEVAGHTDDVGVDAYNLELSRKRTESVASYLISKGIDPKRITTIGYGKSQPLIQSTSDDARRLNRRVEVSFIR